ncbi:MAG: tol-pal system protein YbgF [Azoarcus sp.]|jgi:tol-pal system protein YbgF|nr:tol-pal system protein YbgF [Azoarcus sp.]
MKPLLPLAAFAALFLAGPAQAGLFDDAEARQQINNLKQELQSRLETVSNGQFELANQAEEMRAEVARLRGQLEVLLNEIETLKNRQRDFYIDLDSRMRQLETNAQQTTAPAQTSGAGDGGGNGSYEAALGLLKEGRTAEALAELDTYINNHPDSDNLPEAHFWAGTAALQTKNVAAANKYFNIVLGRWPKSAVAPDAMLGLANGQLAINDRRNARLTLQSLINRYPSSNAAITAKQHLSSSPSSAAR